MNNLIEKISVLIEDTIAPPLIKISQIRYLQVIQSAFVALMPLLIFSSMLMLVAAFPVEWWEDLISPISGALWAGCDATLGLIGVVLSFSVGYYLGEYYKYKNVNIQPIQTGVLSFVVFMMFVPVISTDNGSAMLTGNFGSSSIFAALILAIVSTEIYRLFIKFNLIIKMPEGVPPMVVDAFASLIPSSIVFIIMWILSKVFMLDILSLINTMFQPLVDAGKGPFPQFISFFIDRLLWFVGIHGSNIVSSVMQPIWTEMIAENMEAARIGATIPNLFTAEWNNYFIRLSITPLTLLAAMSSVKRFKAVGKLALPASFFNISEPTYFGLPLVLNPLLFVPYVIGSAFIWVWTYIFTAIIPIVPPAIAQVAWTVPAPIAAFLGTGGSIIALLFSLLNYVIMFFIFLPFFRVMEKQERKLESENSNENC